MWWLAEQPVWPWGPSTAAGELLIQRDARARLSARPRWAGSAHLSQPREHCAEGEVEGWSRRACVFSSCFVHVSPDLFLLSFSISFLVLSVVSCSLILLVPTMHDGETADHLSHLLTDFTLHTVCQQHIIFNNIIYHLLLFQLSIWCHKWTKNVLLIACCHVSVVPFVFF